MRLWHKISTVEDPEWTRRYHDRDPNKKAFGGRVVVSMTDGTVLEDEIAVADAHPAGASPYQRDDYIHKFRTLTEGILAKAEVDRFLDLAIRLPELSPAEVEHLNPVAPDGFLEGNPAIGIFDAPH